MIILGFPVTHRACFLIFFELGLQILIYCYYQFIITSCGLEYANEPNGPEYANEKIKINSVVSSLKLQIKSKKKKPKNEKAHENRFNRPVIDMPIIFGIMAYRSVNG